VLVCFHYSSRPDALCIAWLNSGCDRFPVSIGIFGGWYLEVLLALLCAMILIASTMTIS
jgi:hypothetical protein